MSVYSVSALHAHMQVNPTLPVEALSVLEFAYDDAWQMLHDLKEQLDFMHEHWKASLVGWRWTDVGVATRLKTNKPVYVLTNLDWLAEYYTGQKLLIKEALVSPASTAVFFLAPELQPLIDDDSQSAYPVLVPRNVTVYALGQLVLEALHTDLAGLSAKYPYSPLYYSVYRCLTNRMLFFI
jgi:hypothetical protein